MPDVGDITRPTLTVSPYDLTTDATVTVYKPDGTTSTPTTSTSDGGQTWTATSVTYTAAGWWAFVWTVTGTGAGTETQRVYVGPVIGLPPDLQPLYCSLEDLKESLGIDQDVTDSDAWLLNRIATSSRSIDQCTGRRFWLDDTPVARVINPNRRIVRDPDGERLLLPWDIGSTDGMTVEVGTTSGGWTAVTDYETQPDVALTDNKPITSLLRTGGTWMSSALTRVRVYTRWGYPVLPSTVNEAAMLQSARLRKRRQSPEGVAGNSEFGLIRVSRVDPDVEEMLKYFKRPGIA